jgi:hypothetical protein
MLSSKDLKFECFVNSKMIQLVCIYIWFFGAEFDSSSAIFMHKFIMAHNLIQNLLSGK